MQKLISNKCLLTVTLVIGILYNAWILGFWLNPKIVQTSLLSGLGAIDQPYHEIFIVADILTALLVILLVLGLFFRMRKSKVHSLPLNLLLLSLAAFALSTALAAVFAQPSVQTKSGIPDILTQPIEFLHDGFSVLALACMMIAILLGLFFYRRYYFLLLAIAYFVTLIFSSIEGMFPGTFGPLGQQINLIVTAIWLFMITRRFLYEFDVSPLSES